MNSQIRFTESPDGWLDTRTGLEWSRTLGETSWSDAQSLIPPGWRLPTIAELFSVVDNTRSGPATELPNTQSSSYWSATSYAYYPDGAWYVGFFFGGAYYDFKSLNGYVRGVRGGS